MRTCLPAVLFFLFISVSVFAGGTTYYVAPPAAGGSNANDGSPGSPWATLQHAANQVAAGDTVVTAPGIYAGFNVVSSGLQNSPITFRGQSGAVIDTAAAYYNGNHRSRINIDSQSWIIIEGFEVVGSNDQRTSKEGIRCVASPGTDYGHITIRLCHVHHNGDRNIFTGHYNHLIIHHNVIHHAHDEHGIYISNSGDHHQVFSNTVYSNSGCALHVNSDESQGGDGLIIDVAVGENIMHGNGGGGSYIDPSGNPQISPGGGSAINFDSVQQSRIQNNLLYNNHASGISLYRGDGALPSSGNVVVNNTIHQAADGRWAINISDAATGNTLFNNILLNDHSFRGSLIITSDSLPGLASDSNIVMDRFNVDDGSNITLAQWRALTGQDRSSIALAPAQWPTLFTDLAGDDYHLAPESIARDIGAPQLAGDSAPSYDIEGLPRPLFIGFDIGAYEFPFPDLPCPGDYSGDGDTNSADITTYLAAWFADLQNGTTLADMNSDQVTTSADITAFLAQWFMGIAIPAC
ncbi:MAG: right-handed parallel beta-helix repeat-containing protein [Phycisphaerales bacterium]|nr:right-handed parallel beta-helix repeat-containing protein [Phycisphaerales bacterium]